VDFKDLLRTIQRRWLTIVVFVALALLIATAVSLLVTPRYESTARVFISTETKTSQDAYAASLFTAQRVKSYADLADSREVMQQVIDSLSLDASPGQLAEQVEASVVQDTIIIRLTVTDDDPAQAQKIAQAAAEELSTYVEALETPRGTKKTSIKASIIDPADLNSSAVYPNIPLNLAVAFALGLLIGVSVAVARETLDTTVKTVEDVESLLSAPVMASVSYDSSLAKSRAPADVAVNSVRSEDFRLLRTNLQFADLDGDPRVFVVTSSLSGEGKTSTAIGLAFAVCQAGRRVLLIDGDLRHPSLADALGLEGSVGFTSVLVGRSNLDESIQHHADTGVHVLTSGTIPPNPTEILQSQAARALFSEAREKFDVVIIDSPPLLPVADAAILAVEADGALLVTRHGKTHRQNLTLARARLEAVGARLFGAVLNMTPKAGVEGYGANAYGYRPENKRTAKTP
jgi:receptor protein-tyrosine kinase